MTYMMRSTIYLFLVHILVGCMTVEGPDGKYVLTNEGFKEDKRDTVTPNKTDQSIGTKQPDKAVNKSTSNYRYATGYCNRHGRARDPVPWTSFAFVIDQNIDVVYPKIMREFKYNYKRLKRSNVQTTLPGCDVHLRYEEVPGSHYQMRSYIKHHYGQEQSKNTIEVDLANEGADKVRIQVSYYSGHTKDKSGYEASLKQRVLKALE
jgi:hypothetical protein